MENFLALVPSIGVAFLFYVVIRHFVHADRMERNAIRQLEEDEAAGSEDGPRAGS